MGGEDLLKTGKLNLVDLAGSENISKSGVTDKRARETSHINTSLLTLGRVIVALTEHRVHIPYRESKLTRLLQDSLGGRTKTTLIATVSPASCNVEETLSTLDYASRAKHITNKPEMNQRLTKNALLKDYEDQISKLQRDLQATRLCNGIYIATANYEEIMKELAIQKQEISEKINNIRALKVEMEEKEKVCTELQFQIKQHLEDVKIKTQQIEELETKLDVASSEIANLHTEKEEKEFLVAKHSEAEQSLYQTATKLLNTAETSTSDIEKLHTKLDVIADLNKQNKQTFEQHITEFNNKIKQIQSKSSVFYLAADNFHQSLIDSLAGMKLKQSELNNQHEKLRTSYQQNINSLSEQDVNNSQHQDSMNTITDSFIKQLDLLTTENKEEIKKNCELNLRTTIAKMLKHFEEQTKKTNDIVHNIDDLVSFSTVNTRKI